MMKLDIRIQSHYRAAVAARSDHPRTAAASPREASCPGYPLRVPARTIAYAVPGTPGIIAVRRAPAGAQTNLDLSAPALLPGAVVVATFHTHPNPSAQGW